jgi:hypothetical protein
MKKIILIACIIGTSFFSISQLTWQKGGNSAAGGAVSSIGTNNAWNAPLFFQTFGVNRSRLNGSSISTISGYTANDVSGYMGLGSGGFASVDGWFNNNGR